MRVVATAGHVDHGKSTLLRVLTGTDPDRWEEERRRGLTIDLGFVWARLHGSDGTPLEVAFVDVPGHERFVPNMLAGVGAAPAALFVVAADDGWSAQSTEHLHIVDLVGVAGVAVAVTKTDRVGPDRLAEVVADVREHIRGTCLEGAPIVCTDATSGEGIDALAHVLVDRLAHLPAPRDRGRPRLWIDRAFTIVGAGTVVTGTLAGGSLTVGQEVAIVPHVSAARIRGLEALQAPVRTAAPGSRVAVNLAGVPRDAVDRGDVVVSAGASWRVTDTVDVHLRVLAGHTVGHRGAWHLHAGTARVGCQVHPLLGEVHGGESGFARVVLTAPLALQRGDRLVLRDTGRQTTAAGATVVDLPTGERPRGAALRRERARSLTAVHAAVDEASVVSALVGARGGVAPRDEVLATAGLGQLPHALSGVVELGGDLVRSSDLGRWEAEALDAVRANAPTAGASHASVASALARAGCPERLARSLVERLVRQGRLSRDGTVLVRQEDRRAHAAARGARRRALLAELWRQPLQPPDVDAVAARLGLTTRDLQALVDEGALVRAGSVVFVREAIELAVARLREEHAPGVTFTASEASRTLATSRRYTVALLEHLARRGITRFDGHEHRIV